MTVQKIIENFDQIGIVELNNLLCYQNPKDNHHLEEKDRISILDQLYLAYINTKKSSSINIS